MPDVAIFCTCALTAETSCAALATQEDMLCDVCRRGSLDHFHVREHGSRGRWEPVAGNLLGMRPGDLVTVQSGTYTYHETAVADA